MNRSRGFFMFDLTLAIARAVALPFAQSVEEARRPRTVRVVIRVGDRWTK